MNVATDQDVDLELIFDESPDELHCNSEARHTCSVKARWISHGKAKCNSGKPGASLWCDSRYEYWLECVADDWFCVCGLPQSHWVVNPL